MNRCGLIIVPYGVPPPSAADFRELRAILLTKRFTPQSIPNEVRGVLTRLADLVQRNALSSMEFAEARVLATFAFYALATGHRPVAHKTETR